MAHAVDRIIVALRLAAGLGIAAAGLVAVLPHSTAGLWMASIVLSEDGYWLALLASPLVVDLRAWRRSEDGRPTLRILAATAALAGIVLLLSPVAGACAVARTLPDLLEARFGTPVRSPLAEPPRPAPVSLPALLAGVGAGEVVVEEHVYAVRGRCPARARPPAVGDARLRLPVPGPLRADKHVRRRVVPRRRPAARTVGCRIALAARRKCGFPRPTAWARGDPAAARSHSVSVGCRYVMPVVRLGHDRTPARRSSSRTSPDDDPSAARAGDPNGLRALAQRPRVDTMSSTEVVTPVVTPRPRRGGRQPTTGLPYALASSSGWAKTRGLSTDPGRVPRREFHTRTAG